MYAIKINKTGRYLLWCDDNWYETSSYASYRFTQEQADIIRKQLKKHYVYYVTLEAEATEEKPKTAKTETTVAKKSPFKLKFGKKAV